MTATQNPTTSRGATTVSTKVVAQMAEQAAYEVRGVGSDAGGVLGIGARKDFHSRPKADVEIYGNTVVLRMNVGLAFPTPMKTALTELRQHLTQRIEFFTGLTVGRIDIDISWLNAEAQGRRVLQ